MKALLQAALAALAAITFLPGGLRGQEKADETEKAVRLVWFPRFSPDGKLLAAAHGSWDQKEGGEVRLWNVETGKNTFVLKDPRGVRSVAWSPKGDFLVTGSYAGIVRFYDPRTGQIMGNDFKFGASVEGVRITPDGKRLVTTHGNGNVRVSELPSRKGLHFFEGAHKGGIWGMAVSPDGKLLATGGKDTFVRVFDLESYKLLHEIKHPGETNGVLFTADSRQLLTGCTDATIRVFDVASGQEQAQLMGHDRGSITDMQFSSDGKLLASAGIDGTVRLWDSSDLTKATLKETLMGHSNLVFGVAISPDDRWLASAGWDDKVILWDLQTGKERWSWQR
jgi:WD40 repeat protein